MYEKPFSLEIVAPDKVVFRGEATSFTAPGVEGGFQVLVQSRSASGAAWDRANNGQDRRWERHTEFAVSGGFVRSPKQPCGGPR